MQEYDDYLSFDQPDLRKKNIATILSYVNCRTEEEHLNRWRLYAEDGVRRVTTTTDHRRYNITGPGHAALKASDEWNHRYFPGYHFENNRLFQTQDPNFFVVLSEGKGDIDFPGYGGRRNYDNFFIHTFQMEDGKIKVYSEHLNFCRQFDALDIPLPAMHVPPLEVGGPV